MEFTQACQVLTMSSTELQVLCIKGVEAKRGRVVVNKSLHKEEFDGVVQWVSESMTGME
jgi:formylmethanofuran dehydrogenase subunit D